MRVLIDNSGYDLKNFGDIAMLMSTASKFKKIFPEAEIRIFTNVPEILIKYIPYAIPVSLSGRRLWSSQWNVFGGIHQLFPLKNRKWLRDKEELIQTLKPDFFVKWIAWRLAKRKVPTEGVLEFINEIKSADVVIASGGGFVTDAFEDHACSILQTLAIAQSFGKPTAMFGQGLGPVKSKRLLNWSKQVLPKLRHISLREGLNSRLFALSVGVPKNKIHVTGDDAIFMANSKTPTSIGNGIGINLRIASYSGLNMKGLGPIEATINSTAKELGAKLYGIPIADHEGDSDFESLSLILNSDLFEEVKKLNTPDKVIEQVGKCRIVVTGSYHGGVFALSQGISVIGVISSEYYREKFEGLNHQFGSACLIIDRKSNSFNHELKQAIHNLWLKAESNQLILLKKAAEQINLSTYVYQSFSEKL